MKATQEFHMPSYIDSVTINSVEQEERKAILTLEVPRWDIYPYNHCGYNREHYQFFTFLAEWGGAQGVATGGSEEPPEQFRRIAPGSVENR